MMQLNGEFLKLVNESLICSSIVHEHFLRTKIIYVINTSYFYAVFLYNLRNSFDGFHVSACDFTCRQQPIEFECYCTPDILFDKSARNRHQTFYRCHDVCKNPVQISYYNKTGLQIFVWTEQHCTYLIKMSNILSFFTVISIGIRS